MSPSRAPRADWTRNHEQLLAAAREVVTRDGAEASLEEIARRAGVGSATLHRHFPSRRALLDEVFHHGITELCARAEHIAARADSRTALNRWLEDLAAYATETRGLAEALATDTPPVGGCHGLIRRTAAHLLDAATAAGTLTQPVDLDDLLTLTNAVSLAAGGDPHRARRVFRIVAAGL
ncbi:TetR/AcrR family transcriptional regulator [Nocardia tenerifensis]|uniref:TetR/AcrR family transcriptional regulator n=1 Tax=Nocardia tenerifensis TaxID=228006 RepID=UPI0003120F23|nr:helix-turn-helix domain-containing protein [Nocardia tenerifensis]